MYYIEKTFEISASHHLKLPYESKCSVVHGHNWKITVYCKARELDASGLVADFTDIKKKIMDALDHKDLNKVLGVNPTAENIAQWITEQIPTCYKASVQESEGNKAIYEKD